MQIFTNIRREEVFRVSHVTFCSTQRGVLPSGVSRRRRVSPFVRRALPLFLGWGSSANGREKARREANPPRYMSTIRSFSIPRELRVPNVRSQQPAVAVMAEARGTSRGIESSLRRPSHFERVIDTYSLLLLRFRTSIGDEERNHVVATNHPHTMDEVRNHLPLPCVVATSELLESEPLDDVY